jgi:hypothetical protein
MAVRLKAQVHDSIVGQVAVGEEHWLETIEEIMLRPYMTSLGPVAVPVDLEGPNLHWKEPKVKEKLAVVMEDEIDEGIIAG